MNRLFPHLRLVRVQNLILVGGSVMLGGWLEGLELDRPDLILAALSCIFIAAFGYAFNDYCDIQSDRVNKPKRPLVQGSISPVQALIYGAVYLTIGLGLALWVNLFTFSAGLSGGIVLFYYNLRWKKSFLVGNLAVSFLCAGSFAYGGLSVPQLTLSLVPAVFAFAFHFGREILKDTEDQIADRKVQARTLPLQLGNRLSLIVITVTFSILILLTFLPYFLNWLNQKYLILAVLGVDWLLLYTLWSMWKDNSAANLSRLSTILKINMFLGLIAISIGRL